MPEFKSIQQLSAWMASKGIDTKKWKIGSAKSVKDLWAEIAAGESRIQDDPPLRVVKVVNIVIRSGDTILVEGEQEFGQNQRRHRGILPSEKLKPGEDCIDAALRGIQEELQVEPTRVKVISSSPSPKTVISESQSYPGLHTKYVIYTVEVEIEDLPNEDFNTLEISNNHDDPVQKHIWRWRSQA